MFKKALLILAATTIVSAAHANEYDDCMFKAGAIGDTAMAACYTEETKRIMQDIKSVYEDAAKDKKLAKWSGGVGMQSGNLRNMFETWLKYRNTYCSYYTVGNSEYLGTDEHNNAYCVMTLTKKHLTDVKKVVITSGSYLVAPEFQ
ncbi:MAG: DUF1311 domain-containing protein [Lactobacillus sp.]|jgi:uncharacterized protein YecT (DUF1311 family)|nr:DUF1311 domain-containing protein [Lactobacillus sp.]